MHWLIVEDALLDRKGHWFEYLGTFTRELRALGDEVTLLADSAAEPFIVEQLQAKPVLPPSIWHRMGDGTGALRRYLRVPAHAFQTYQALRRFFSSGKTYDVIFVPTVLLHHLLGWKWLIRGRSIKKSSRIILFFPNTPIYLNSKTGQPAWASAPTAKLFCRVIRSLKKEVVSGRVILGVETEAMREALTTLTDVPFTYFPHPVAAMPQMDERKGGAAGNNIIMGSYGGARHEKGSDLLVAAVDEFCRRHPDSHVQFILQSVGGDTEVWKSLDGNHKVRLVPDYFADGEYLRHLAMTQVLLLPYRRSSYALRVSRVVIEAMVHGIPIVVTRGTTLASQAQEYGAAVLCENGDVESLVKAIAEMEKRYEEFRQEAEGRKTKARAHFSVKKFREILLAASGQTVGVI